MSLNRISAINYNNGCGYSQKAIGIIQMFVGANSVGKFDNQTVEAVYKMQSPKYGFAAGAADGKVGPSTLGVIIIELEHLYRAHEAAVLKTYCYRNKLTGKLENSHKKAQLPTQPDSPEPKPTPEPDEEPIPLKEKHIARLAKINQVRNIWTGPGTIPHPAGGSEGVRVGKLYLGSKEIRQVLGGSMDYIYYMVVMTESAALDPFLVGKVYVQTNVGFWSEIQWAWGREVKRNGQGGQEMMKKEVELLMGAVCAGVGAFGGIAAITGASMNMLFSNSDEIFTAGRALGELIKVKNKLSRSTPEFWLLCVTVLKLSAAKTPQAIWTDAYASTRLMGELLMIVGEAVLLKQFKRFGWVLDIIIKLMQTALAKLIDSATIALEGKDLIKEMKKLDPSLNDERAIKIIKELKDNWHIVQPALVSLKAALEQVVEIAASNKKPDYWY